MNHNLVKICTDLFLPIQVTFYDRKHKLLVTTNGSNSQPTHLWLIYFTEYGSIKSCGCNITVAAAGFKVLCSWVRVNNLGANGFIVLSIGTGTLQYLHKNMVITLWAK